MVYHFFSHVPDSQHRPFADGADAAEVAKQIRPLLETPEAAAKLFDTMLSEFTAASPDVKGFTGMMFAMRDMGAFVRGDSPMFSPLPESALQAEREVKERNRTKGQPAQEADVADTPVEASGNLAAVARAFASKRKPEIEAQGHEQFTLFSTPPDLPVEAERQKQVAAEEKEAATRYDLGYGHLGNGLTVWNRQQEEHGDYKTVAHISPDQTVAFYDQDMLEVVKAQIRKMALTAEMSISATQDAPVFSVPPQVPEQSQEVESILENEPDTVPYDFKFEYRLLSRLKSDCEYFLGAGQRQIKYLSEGSIEAQIAKMRELYNLLPEKPEWLTAEDIDRYEAQMLGNTPKLSTQQTVAASEQPHNQDAPAQKEANVFAYNGFHFEPIGKFPENEPQERIIQYTISRNELGMSRYEGAKHPYSHAAFYAASGGTTADVFLCKETNKVYVPGENELFEYAGGYELLLSPRQQTVETPVQEGEKTASAPEIDGPTTAEEVSKNLAPTPRSGRTRPELNYRTFEKMFPEVISGEYRYLQMQSGPSMMPLHIEWIDADVIAVSHTYEQNGDLMRDPEMTFRVDREKGTLEPLTFRQDGVPQIYQEVYPEPGQWIPKLSRDLSSFAQQWFKNISQQGYIKERAVAERDGKDVDIQFAPDGTVIAPQPNQME